MGIFDVFKKKQCKENVMDVVKFYECYNFSEQWYLIEMLLNVPALDVDWGNMTVPQKGISKTEWQVPCMEQYLNEDGSAKICDTYDVPKENVRPCRVAFFVFKVSERILSTPYGDFPLSDAKPMPERLKNIIEFEESD